MTLKELLPIIWASVALGLPWVYLAARIATLGALKTLKEDEERRKRNG